MQKGGIRMNPFDSYLKKIIANIDVSEEEKHELYTEFLDHLTQLKAEYIAKGFSESESIQMAINAFGDTEKVGKSLEKAIFPYKQWINGCAWIGLLIYIAVVLQLLFFDEFRLSSREHVITSGVEPTSRYNLVPFKNIITYLLNFEHYNFNTWFFNTFGNILIFLPFGVLLPVLFSKARSALRILGYSLAFSLAIEIIQVTTKLGYFDVDDLILNTFGGYVGFILWMLMNKIIAKLTKKTKPTIA
jgi:glycopeptide antibiotics resistance protein